MRKLLLKLILVVTCLVALLFYVSQPIDLSGYIKSLFMPTPATVKIDSTVIVQEIHKLSRLETAVVNSERIIPGERNRDKLWGVFGETMTFIAYGQVVAGVDLNNFTKNDILVIDSNSIEVKLPKAEIFNVIIDNQKSYVASRYKGPLASSDKDMESKVRQLAEIDCQNNALGQGILDKADANAKDTVSNLLLGFGFKVVSFISS